MRSKGEGEKDGPHVSRFRVLDRNFRSNVLSRRYARNSPFIFRTNRLFCTFRLFKINRAYVYLCVWRVLNCILYRLYLLYNVLVHPWRRALKEQH